MIKKITNTKVILSVLGAIILLIKFGFINHQKKIEVLSGFPFKSLDARFSYTYTEVTTLCTSIGNRGIEIYLFIEKIIDVIYPILYGTLFCLLILRLVYQLKKPSFYKLVLLPLLIVVFDGIENYNIIRLLNNFPNITKEQVVTTSTFTSIKWVFVLVTLITIITLSLMAFAKRK